MSEIERAIKRIEKNMGILDIRIRCGHGTPEIQEWKQEYQLAIEALCEKQERENPQPLTLEELRGMAGQSVWIITLRNRECSHWVILDKKCPVDFELQDVNLENGDCYATYDLGETWLAYNHPPKEE